MIHLFVCTASCMKLSYSSFPCCMTPSTEILAHLCTVSFALPKSLYDDVTSIQGLLYDSFHRNTAVIYCNHITCTYYSSLSLSKLEQWNQKLSVAIHLGSFAWHYIWFCFCIVWMIQYPYHNYEKVVRWMRKIILSSLIHCSRHWSSTVILWSRPSSQGMSGDISPW